MSPSGRVSTSAADDSAWLDVKLKIIEVLRAISKSGSLASSHATGSITPSTATDSPDGLMHLILDHISDEGKGSYVIYGTYYRIVRLI